MWKEWETIKEERRKNTEVGNIICKYQVVNSIYVDYLCRVWPCCYLPHAKHLLGDQKFYDDYFYDKSNNLLEKDFREIMNDVFYDVCKFYQSLHVHSNNLANLVAGKDFITSDDTVRLELFRDSDVYKNNKHKIELGVGCLWLCMAPLNVNRELNHQLFVWAMKHLAETM